MELQGKLELLARSAQYDLCGSGRGPQGSRIREGATRWIYPAVLPDGKVKLIGPLPFVCGDLKTTSLLEIWERYKRAWKDERVVQFTRRVISDPTLLALSNKWVELY